jgi:hypothetical protein
VIFLPLHNESVKHIFKTKIIAMRKDIYFKIGLSAFFLSINFISLAQNDRSPAIIVPEPGTSIEVIDQNGNSKVEPATNNSESKGAGESNSGGNNNDSKGGNESSGNDNKGGDPNCLGAIKSINVIRNDKNIK